MTDHFTHPFDVDAVVIGAGIIGASCGYHLAARGLPVAVLEAMSAPAEGSTGRSFAAVRAQWTDAVNIKLSWRSIKAYAEFEKRHGIDVGYRAEGYMFLIPDEYWDEHKEAVALQRSLGAPVSVLTVEQGRAITPFNPEGIACATLGEADGRVDAHLVTDAYLQLARRFDVPLLLRQPVSAVGYDGHRWHLECPSVRPARNSWSMRLAVGQVRSPRWRGSSCHQFSAPCLTSRGGSTPAASRGTGSCRHPKSGGSSPNK